MNTTHRLFLAMATVLLTVVPPAYLPAQTGEPQEKEESAEPADADLQDRLTRIYGQVPELEPISVTVDSGVVRLTGTVKRPTARDNAEAIARRFDQTVFVDNRLDIEDTPAAPRDAEGEQTVQDEAIQTRLATIFGRVDELNNIGVEVQTGVVHLTGETTSLEAYKQADRLASELEGVLYVDNDIEMPHDVGERVTPALERAWTKFLEAADLLPLLLVALVVLTLFWFLARVVSRIPLPGKRLSDQPFVQNIVRQVISTVVFLMGILFVLELFDVTTLVGAVLGTAGVAGLALGFAFRDIAENYLASILLGVQQPFNKNDYVEIGDYKGKVIRLTTRETVLMTLEGNHIRIPNATVFKNPTSNYTRNPMRRFEFRAGIGVEEDLVDAQKVGLGALREMVGVAEDPEPFAYVDELGDSSVVVAFHGWVDQREFDWAKVRSEAVRRTKNALDAAGIEMPEPIQRVLNADFEAAEEAEQERQQRAARELEEPGMEVELSPELDEQIEEDREHSAETDLLQE